MPPRPLIPFHRLLSTTIAPTTPTPLPKPTDSAFLVRLCTVLYQHQRASDAALDLRLSALPLPPASSHHELFLQVSARFSLSWRPVHRFLLYLSALHSFRHSPATAARLLDVLAKAHHVSLLHSTLLSLPSHLLSPSALRAALRGLAPAREVAKISSLLTIFPVTDRPHILTTITQVICSTCKLPDVAEKVVKQAKHRYGVARTSRCCELVVIAYCRAGLFIDACRVWNGVESDELEPGAAAYEEIVVTLFKNNRVADAIKVFDVMRRRVSLDCRGAFYRAVVSWLCKEGRVRGAYMVFCEMVKRGMELDGEVFGDLVYGLLVRRRVREGYRVFCGANERDIGLYHGLIKGLVRIKRAAEATKVFREMVERGCEPNMHTYIMLLQGHLGKRGRKGRDQLVNFESIFVGGLVKAGRTLEATKFVERTMWGGVNVPRFDYNKFLHFFSNDEGVVMFEEVGRRLREVGLVDLGDILSTYGERMATRDRRRRAMNGLLTVG